LSFATSPGSGGAITSRGRPTAHPLKKQLATEITEFTENNQGHEYFRCLTILVHVVCGFNSLNFSVFSVPSVAELQTSD
jgi:hypothetical protein